MDDGLGRRDFLKSLSLTGAAIAGLAPDRTAARLSGTRGQGIQNDHFRVSFDRRNGTLEIRRADDTPFLTGGTARINFAAPDAARAAGLGPLTHNRSGDYRHAVHSDTIRDALGAGKRLIVVSRAPDETADLTLHVTLYDRLPAITIEAFCRNVSSQDLVIHSLEPVRAAGKDGGALHVAGVSKCLTNGEMYYDTGSLHRFGNSDGAIASGELEGVTLANGPFAGENETIHSWWNACLFSGHDKEGVVLGYLENNDALGNLLISRSAKGEISFLAESVYAPAVVLHPGQTIRSNRLMMDTAATPYAALESYAAAVGEANRARTGSIVNGWSSWFYTLAQVSEAEVVANTLFAAEHLAPFGLEYVQIDEGYQRWHGDWEGNERFPHGMKWLADTIRGHGLKAGLWISPYVVSGPTEVVRSHPEWLVQNPDGTPQRIGNWPAGAGPPADENPKRFCLDVTHPGAAQWLHDLVHTIAHDWGYEMIKIDFVAWSILAARRFHDPTVSSAEAYRKGMEIMRRAAGDKCHILECGPGATTVGLIDSMRIEADVNYGYAEAAWETYFVHPSCSAAAAAKRYYFHKRTWINDVDHLCMNLLTNQQSEAAATIIALSGGNTMSGDRLAQLDPYQLEILKKVTPSSGQAAVPVDLFDSDIPSVFALRVARPFGEWTVAALFNPSLSETVEKRLPMATLGLSPEKNYLAFDFWKQQLAGEVRGELRVTLQPGSVTLLALHEKPDRPRVIGTDRHVLQGVMEIERAAWDEGRRRLSAVSVGPRGSSHKVSVYVPGEHPWTWGGYVLYRDHQSYSLKLVHENVIEVQVRFDKADRVEWALDYERFFGR